MMKSAEYKYAGSTVIDGKLIPKFRGMRMEITFSDKKKYCRTVKHKNKKDY